jgi:glutathione S-transferase
MTMSLQLYFSPGACSFVPHAMLEMSGADYVPTLVKLHKGEQQEAAYQAINPRGQVPVLVDDGQVITQIVAIALYLDQKFPAASFLPTEALARAKALETLVWMNNTVHTTFAHIFMPHKFSDQPEVQAQLKTYNTEVYRHLLAELQTLVVASQSAGQPWLSGAQCGPLDTYGLTLTRWGSLAGIDPQSFPALWAWVNQVATQPAVARVIERERLQLNVYRPT